MLSLENLIHSPILIRLCISLAVLFIVMVVKRHLNNWVIKLFSHIHFHKVRLEIDSLNRLQKPINYILVVTGIYIALSVSPFVAYSKEQFLHIGEMEILISIIPSKSIFNLYLAIALSMVTWIVYELERIYEQFFTELNEKLVLVENTVFIRYLARIINFFTLALGVSAVLVVLVPGISSILTGVGIGGAALALVAKDSLTSMIAGMFLLLDKPFIIGDWVSLDSVEGIVEDISFRSTRVRTFTQGLVIVPNSKISNADITNWSRMEKRRVSFLFGVSYNTTPDQITDLTDCIKNMLAQLEGVEKDTPLVNFTSFGDFSLNIQIIYYTLTTKAAEYLAIQEQVNLELLRICEENQIEIPFPTQTILMPKANES
ncbi:MAG: mechanosensitive ion channel family protein [Cellulosilyticum sp.]|nr:mechanosensitive ion channel family protein [Cellulosilyticum sp.]